MLRPLTNSEYLILESEVEYGSQTSQEDSGSEFILDNDHIPFTYNEFNDLVLDQTQLKLINILIHFCVIDNKSIYDIL